MDITLITKLDIKYRTLLNKYGINTPLRKAHFWGQIYHESKCKPIQENLNYTAKRLTEVFHKYFPTLEEAAKYYGKPQKIANRVYGNRMGNGDENTGEGWKFSGKGFIQVTGKNNYTKLSSATGIDFVSHPELLLEEANALISALWYWESIKGNKFADKDDVRTITKLINGGTIGLSDRQSNVEALKKVFK